MPHIALMPQLRFLGAQDTVAGDDGFVALSRSRSIEYIWGRRCHNLRRRGFLALAGDAGAARAVGQLPQRRRRGVAALPRFPALRELMPMDVPDAGYRHIGQCTELDSLVLMYCRDTTDAATRAHRRPVEADVLLQQLHDDHRSHTGTAVGDGLTRARHVRRLPPPDQRGRRRARPAAAAARAARQRPRRYRGVGRPFPPSSPCTREPDGDLQRSTSEPGPEVGDGGGRRAEVEGRQVGRRVREDESASVFQRAACRRPLGRERPFHRHAADGAHRGLVVDGCSPLRPRLRWTAMWKTAAPPSACRRRRRWRRPPAGTAACRARSETADARRPSRSRPHDHGEWTGAGSAQRPAVEQPRALRRLAAGVGGVIDPEQLEISVGEEERRHAVPGPSACCRNLHGCRSAAAPLPRARLRRRG